MERGARGTRERREERSRAPPEGKERLFASDLALESGLDGAGYDSSENFALQVPVLWSGAAAAKGSAVLADGAAKSSATRAGGPAMGSALPESD
jgi:hypothetical protein